uniref:Uncharacterized protein n=1 Tax=Chenopodium quinoa TaxID=63459 RepID=A0A803N981_CHEQI
MTRTASQRCDAAKERLEVVEQRWELKQKPGINPPRGGFHLDDPNQQIVADEDIFDEYGGFLNGGNIPELLTNFNFITHKKKSKGKNYKKNISRRKDHDEDSSSSDRDNDRRSSKMKHSSKRKQKWASHRQSHEGNSPVSHGDSGKLKGKSSSKHKQRRLHLDTDQESSFSSDSYEHKRRSRKRRIHNKTNRKDLSHSSMSEDSVDERYHGRSKHKDLRRHKKSKSLHEGGPSGEEKSSKKGTLIGYSLGIVGQLFLKAMLSSPLKKSWMSMGDLENISANHIFGLGEFLTCSESVTRFLIFQ